ncbi:MAG: T9SS type A sorting domain-containing protein, partial [Bacteroidetes bacterium]|nr:T9SS type A sorting domain-containing protein [Bacteroidota bacterium]
IPRPVSGIQFTLIDTPDFATTINYDSNLECFAADFNDVNGSAITIFFSIDGCIIEEGSYEFATITYTIDPDVSLGDVIELWPEDVTISDPNGLPMEHLVSSGMITIGLSGDVNTDGDVNVLDIVNLVSYILLVENPTDDQFSGGDINGDNILNVLDVVQIVNIIIGFDDLGNYSSGGSAFLSIDHQFLKLEGSNVGGFQLNSNSGFSIISKDLPEDWTLRTNRNMLIAYSTGEPLNGEISIQYSGRLTVDDLLVSDAAGEKISTEFVAVPEQFRLYANYPNPFNPQTTIRFDLDEPNRVSLRIYNILGEEVTELTNQYLPAGYHEVVWDASNQTDGLAKQTSSIYFVKLTAGQKASVQKIILMK